jgi:DNA-3-methyladenine glycosylase
MSIDRKLDREPLDGKTIFITPADLPIAVDDIAVTPRVGVDYAGDATHWPLRFFLSGNRYVSVNRQFKAR